MSALQPEESPGFLLWRVSLRWQRLMVATLKPLGLTHVQFVFLVSTWWLQHEGGGPPTQRQLADHAGTEPAMTSQVLRTLEQRQLIERRADPTDARARRLVVTIAGAALARESVQLVEQADAAFFATTLRRQLLPALRELAADR